MLSVPDCPNLAVLEGRLAEVLGDRPSVSLVRRVIDDVEDAERWGMRGSPTLLVNGVDPFAGPDVRASLSCRVFRTPDGKLDGAPTVIALQHAVRRAAGAGGRGPGVVSTEVAGLSVAPPAETCDRLNRAGAGRLAPVEDGLRLVQQRVLMAFAETGRLPSVVELERVAGSDAVDVGRVLAQLHEADFLRLDAAGEIRIAYPFSATATPHTVQIEGGPRVHAVCAVDALGVAAMLGVAVTIHSAEPTSGEPITVRVDGGAANGVWEPPAAVVFVGLQTDSLCCKPGPSAPAEEVCCGYVNFFRSTAQAEAWTSEHHRVAGQVLGQTQALQLGGQIFRPLLTGVR